MFSRLLSRNSKKQNRIHRNRRTRKPRFESLESRQLMCADVFCGIDCPWDSPDDGFRIDFKLDLAETGDANRGSHPDHGSSNCDDLANPRFGFESGDWRDQDGDGVAQSVDCDDVDTDSDGQGNDVEPDVDGSGDANRGGKPGKGSSSCDDLADPPYGFESGDWRDQDGDGVAQGVNCDDVDTDSDGHGNDIEPDEEVDNQADGRTRTGSIDPLSDPGKFRHEDHGQPDRGSIDPISNPDKFKQDGGDAQPIEMPPKPDLQRDPIPQQEGDSLLGRGGEVDRNGIKANSGSIDPISDRDKFGHPGHKGNPIPVVRNSANQTGDQLPEPEDYVEDPSRDNAVDESDEPIELPPAPDLRRDPIGLPEADRGMPPIGGLDSQLGSHVAAIDTLFGLDEDLFAG